MNADFPLHAPDEWSIDVHSAEGMRIWAGRLGVSEDRIRRAVAVVGASATAVRDRLAQPDTMRLSTTGAVLGRPDLEHAAYGMVQGGQGGPAPSATERQIRGLGPQTLPVDKV